MINPILIQRRQRRYKPRAVTQTAPVVLTLEAASYSSSALTLLLTFDRAVSIAGYLGSAVTVNDGVTNDLAYGGTGGASQPAGNQVLISLVAGRPYAGGVVTLHVTSSSGIVAVNDGGTWAGANYISLPYGS